MEKQGRSRGNRGNGLAHSQMGDRRWEMGTGREREREREGEGEGEGGRRLARGGQRLGQGWGGLRGVGAAIKVDE